MKSVIISFFGLAAALPALAQQPAAGGSVPIFHVSVVQSTVTAINYQYRQGPTKIDFRGTILMPDAKGNATVESKRGRTEIDADFDRVLPPQRFGREYLTYTLWAVTPEGGVRNLAEVVPGPSNKAHVRVSTDLQAFGLIVTAEPYSAARRPSNVVVLENHVRPDTEGKIEQVQAKYELMPRGQYTWHEPTALSGEVTNAPKVSMNRYEAILEVYEAQNALGIAQSANALQYASQTYAKAQQLYQTAQQMEAKKGDTGVIVQNAREAAEIADDARQIAERRQEQEKLTSAQAAVSQAQQAQALALQQTQIAQQQASAAEARADAEQAARRRAEADAAAARAQAARADANAQAALRAPKTTVLVPERDTRASQLRMALLEQMNGVVSMRDTTRGLMATIPDSAFSGTEPGPAVAGQLARLATIIEAHPGLHVAVEGNSDSDAGADAASARAESIRRALIMDGFPENAVSARGLGDTRPFGPNSTSADRAANRRVEIIVSGDAIGNLPLWDHPYPLTSSR